MDLILFLFVLIGIVVIIVQLHQLKKSGKVLNITEKHVYIPKKNIHSNKHVLSDDDVLDD